MQLTEIAELVGGEIVRGDPGLSVAGVAGIENATGTELSFYQSKKYEQAALDSGAGALLVAQVLDGSDAAQVKVDHPYLRFLQIVRHFHPEVRPEPGVHPSAVVHASADVAGTASVGPTAVIDEGARVGEGTVIGPGNFIGRDAVIGKDCFLHANVSVREQCRLGDRVILHVGVVIGSDGFGYVRIPSEHVKIPHIGIVRVEDDVEIGANSTVDRGTFGETVIGAGAKVDNLVQIGHNVKVGPRVLLCAQAGISGSSSIGADAVLAGQVGVADHATVGEAAIVTAQSGVATRVKPGTIVSGSPVYPHEAWLKFSASRSRVAKLLERVRALEKKLKD